MYYYLRISMLSLLYSCIFLVAYAQQKPRIKMILLSNHTLAEVNFREGQFIEYTARMTELLRVFFENDAVGKDVSVRIRLSSDSLPVYHLAARPALRDEETEKLLTALHKVKSINTRIVDFDFVLEVDVNNGCRCPDSNWVPPHVNPYLEAENTYKEANLAEKTEILKQWSKEVVLPVLMAFTRQVDNEYSAVRVTGIRFSRINLDSVIDVKKHTDYDEFYWRAVMEMEPNNFLIISMKIFLHVAAGEFDIAARYAELLSLFKHNKTIADYYLDELLGKLYLLINEINTEITNGILMYEDKRFQDAVGHFSWLAEIIPASAWLQFELFYAEQEMNFFYDSNYSEYREAWLLAKEKVYAADPLFALSVSPNSAEEAYLLMRRISSAYLFNAPQNKHKDFLELADIALDLRYYTFAAHLYWLALTHFSNKELENRNIIAYILFALNKAKMDEITSLFSDNYKREFKKIEKSLKIRMVESQEYQKFQLKQKNAR